MLAFSLFFCFALFSISQSAVQVHSTRHFTLVLDKQNILLNGNLYEKITVNGTTPGPELRVNVGDNLIVKVINNMPNSSTTVHWHGMKQHGTQSNDGVIDMTQCKIPFAKEGNNVMVYEFQASTAGTYWYHGHFQEQYVDGLYGALIVMDVDGSTLVDNSNWTWMVSDWYDSPADQLIGHYLSPASGGDEPTPDRYVVNNVFTDNFTVMTNHDDLIRLRLINSAAFSMFNISIDGMPLTIIEIDGVLIEPLVIPYVVLNVAQRVSVKLDWNLLDVRVRSSPSIRIRIHGVPEMYPTFPSVIGSTTDLPLSDSWLGLISFSHNGIEPVPPSYDTAPFLENLDPPTDTNLLGASPLEAEVSDII